MAARRPLTVVSLGGSLLVPREGKIDYRFLKQFTNSIQERVRRGNRFIIMVGGGKTARLYQHAAQQVGSLVPEDLDWLGIHTTRLNAHLVRTILRRIAHPRINTDPNEIEPFREPVLVGAGWRPGCSTDFDATMLAVRYGAQSIINLSNIDYVYSADPRKVKGAVRLPRVTWSEFRKLVGNHWTPGGSFPFDPIASKLAQRHHLRVLVMNGKPLKYFNTYLTTGRCRGTIIED